MTLTLFASFFLFLVAKTVSSNVETRFAEVGETVRLSCPEISSQFNFWFGPPKMTQYSSGFIINPDVTKTISVIVNQESEEFSLEIHNVSILDSGIYRCRVLNDLPKDYDFQLFIRYPPGIKVQLDLSRTNAEQLAIKCVPNGQQEHYSFLWEHLSIFGEHIRYLTAQSNGDAVVLVEQSHYQSSGIYRCLATYGPPWRTNKALIVEETTVLVKGKPFVIAVNQTDTENCDQGELSAFVYSYPKYSNISVSYNGQLKHIYSNKDSMDQEYPKEKLIEIIKPIHGVYVRLHVYKVTFVNFIVADNGSKNYTVFVENEYGHDEHTVRAVSKGCFYQTGHKVRWITGGGFGTVLFGFIVVVAAYYCRKSKPSETLNSQNSDNSGMHHEYDEIEIVSEHTLGVSTSLAVNVTYEDEMESDKEDYIVPMSRSLHVHVEENNRNEYVKAIQAANNAVEYKKNDTESKDSFDIGFEEYLKNADNSNSDGERSSDCENDDRYQNPYQQIILEPNHNHDYL